MGLLASLAVAAACTVLPAARSVTTTAIGFLRRRRADKREQQALIRRQVEAYQHHLERQVETTRLLAVHERQHGEQLGALLRDGLRALERLAGRHEAQAARAAEGHQRQLQRTADVLEQSLAATREQLGQWAVVLERREALHQQQLQEMQGQYLVLVGFVMFLGFVGVLFLA